MVIVLIIILTIYFVNVFQAMSFQQRAVLMSERVLGVDHPNTISEYVSSLLIFSFPSFFFIFYVNLKCQILQIFCKTRKSFYDKCFMIFVKVEEKK